MYRADGEPGSPHEAEQRAPDASEHPGSRPEIKRDVEVRKPTTLNEALAEAAAIGEANAKATAARSKTDDVMQSAGGNARHDDRHAGHGGGQPATQRRRPCCRHPGDPQRATEGIGMPTPAITTAATTVTARSTCSRASWHRKCAARAATSRDRPHNVTIQLVMPEAGVQYTAENKEDRAAVPDAAEVGAAAARRVAARRRTNPNVN